MQKFLLCFVCLVQIGFCQKNEIKSQYFEAHKLIYSSFANETTDAKAEALLQGILKSETKDKKFAYFYCQSYEKLGILTEAKGKIEEAKNLYKNAIIYGIHAKLADSVFFRPYLYLSAILLEQSKFDSLLYCLENAEKILKKYHQLPEAERLFNSLGILQFEAGNYRQSLNYFQKVSSLKDYDLYTNTINQSMVLEHLFEPDSALVLLQKLQNSYPKDISVRLNIATLYNTLGKPAYARHTLSTIKYDHSIVYNNTLAKAYLLENNHQKAQEIYIKVLNTKSQKKEQLAIALSNLAKIMALKTDWHKAIWYIHQALVLTNPNQKSSNIFNNNSSNQTGFSSSLIADFLFEKGSYWAQLYYKYKKNYYFTAAINSFDTYKLQIENSAKFYSSEKAKLDLIQKSTERLQLITDFYLKSASITKNLDLYKKAFLAAESHKSIILQLQINEQTLLPKELKQKIDQLNLQINLIKNSQLSTSQNSLIKNLNSQLVEKELELGQIKQKTAPSHVKPRGIKSISKLQELLSKHQALITIAKANREYHLFYIDKHNFHHHNIGSVHSIDQKVKQINIVDENALHYFYNRIITPSITYLKSKTEIIYIGDGALHTLPIDALTDPKGRYVIEKWAVQTLFSANFMAKPFKNQIKNLLGIAPFTLQNHTYYLPNSGRELNNIPVKYSLTNTDATPAAFISYLAKSNSLHVATHAIGNNLNPELSYIRFMPDKQNIDKMYLYELGTRYMQNIDLTFLSACNSYSSTTNTAEGAIGLARGFFMAGSKNVISSIWPANDYTTAYLAEKFYHYVIKGYSYSHALRKAKIHLLSDPKMSQFVAPKYWAHLVLTGQLGYNNTTATYSQILSISVVLIILLSIRHKVKIS